MKPFTFSDLAAMAAGQALSLLAACVSTWGVWLWLAKAHPFQ
jgi:hypothetical protein